MLHFCVRGSKLARANEFNAEQGAYKEAACIMQIARSYLKERGVLINAPISGNQLGEPIVLPGERCRAPALGGTRGGAERGDKVRARVAGRGKGRGRGAHLHNLPLTSG